MSDREPSERGREQVRRVGVRFSGSAMVTMCESDKEGWTVGDWVLVEAHNERRPGRVVVAPGRWRGSPNDSPWRVIGALPQEEIATVSVSAEVVASGTGTGPEFGSNGPVRSSGTPGGDVSGPSLSGEDDRFQRVKLGLPRLGQRVTVNDAQGVVLAVDTVRRSVTCAMESDGFEVVVPAEHVVPASSD